MLRESLEVRHRLIELLYKSERERVKRKKEEGRKEMGKGLLENSLRLFLSWT